MIDSSIVVIILAGIGGIGVVGITEMIKKALKATGVAAYFISLVVSAGATAYYLISTSTFAAFPFIGYTVLVFLAANGIYKATSGPTA